MNQLDFWHDDIDSRHIKAVCKILSLDEKAHSQLDFRILKLGICKEQ